VTAAGKHLQDGHDSLPSAQKSIFASSKRSGAMHAASVVKPAKKGGVTWADGANTTIPSASDRCHFQDSGNLCSTITKHGLSFL